MKGSISPSNHWQIWVVLLVGILATGMLAWISLGKTAFQWTYPLDDTFIHLAIAKNIALHGNWGLTPNQFQFSSSSPGFTVILALFSLIIGAKVWLPLLINSLLVIGFWIWLRNRFQANKDLLAAGIFILGPVPLLLLLGMEHLLHSYLALVWVWRCVKEVSNDERLSWQTYALAAMSVAVRYESLFLLAALVLLTFVRKKWREGSLLLLLGITPVLLIGGISLLHGGTFLPLPIWMKGHAPGVDFGAAVQWSMAGLNRMYEIHLCSFSPWDSCL